MKVKRSDVDGMFYPASQSELDKMIEGFLEKAGSVDYKPKALIVPHAGYIYSGPIAATGYKSLKSVASKIKRVVVLSPSHRAYFQGMAVSSAEGFQTPLGVVPVDRQKVEEIKKFSQVLVLDEAFVGEHALEVQLPFIQKVLGHVPIIPMIVSGISAEDVSEVLNQLWDEETLLVVSSDLSHFNSYEIAQEKDRWTAHLIEEMKYQSLEGDMACGHFPLIGLLHLALSRKLHITNVDLRNSGDTQGDRSRVVGYGAFIVY